MRVSALGVMTGPICDALVQAVARPCAPAVSAIRSVNSVRASPTVIATEAARQRCPAQPKLESAMMRLVMSMSASGRMTAGFLAPPWHWARLPFAVARL